MIVLRTAGEYELSCTPNHPILTPQGWMPAGELQIGDQVVCRPLVDWMSAQTTRAVDGQDMPSRIEEVAKALALAGSTATAVPTADEDFHGDGVGSEVAVIWTDRLLGNGDEPKLSQARVKADLVPRSMQAAFLAGEGAAFHLGERHTSAAACRMGLRGSLESFVRGHMVVHDNSRGAAVAGLDARLDEAEPDRMTGNSVLLGDRQLTLAGAISADDLPGGQRKAGRAGEAAGFDVAGDGREAEAQALRDLLSGEAGAIETQELVDYKRVGFRGHVYNLQTRTGHYDAEGIVTHNCRCALLPVRRLPQ